ncbi:glycosyltransferase [Mucilaginibacter panaciglaebae]|uniref:Spore protein YkvP/CgeB glycosyl transferase-like domain-containing protein n=1 Tax=Mucilaginibacter panaciglaebae TaxID=502331 RepID=A0ABP7WBN9_9SPHI
MKIFLSFLQSTIQHPVPAYDFWQYYVKNGIEEAGYEWTECPDADWALGLVPQTPEKRSEWKERVWSQTISWLRSNPVDLFLSYLYPEQIETSAINEIKRMGIPCVNFYCDNIRQFGEAPKEFSVFDLNWVPEFKAIKLYQKAGYRYINLPMPMWIEPNKRMVHAEANNQITFIGSKDIQRTLFFEKVVKQCPSINLYIYGNGWKDVPQYTGRTESGFNKIGYQFSFIKQHGLIPYLRKIKQRNLNTDISEALRFKVNNITDFENYNKLTAESMVTVGINRYPSYRYPLFKPDTYSRLRDIEAPMLGACYLTEYTEGLEYLYDIGKEIETYTSTEDFIEKVSMLTANTNLRQRLKVNGQKRAVSTHNIQNSISQIIQRLI